MTTAPRDSINIHLEQTGSEITEARVTATRDLGGHSPSAAAKVVVPIPIGLSLPFIPSIAETLEFCITTGYPLRHA